MYNPIEHLLNYIKSFFPNKPSKQLSIEIAYNFWPTNECWECKKEINNKTSTFSPWYEFVQIGNQVYQVPICDECVAKERENQEPMLKKE